MGGICDECHKNSAWLGYVCAPYSRNYCRECLAALMEKIKGGKSGMAK